MVLDCRRARAVACYRRPVRSVADSLKDEDREALSALSPARRVALALALGARDLELFRLAHTPALDPEPARRELERRRQAGRRRSRALEELIG
jgi:hypothetical protein